MADQVNTSVSQRLSVTGLTGVLFWQADSRYAEVPKQFVRLYGQSTQRNATSGSLASKGIETEAIDTAVAFTGGKTVTLSHPSPSNLTYVKSGQYYDLDGNQISVSVTYDPVKNQLVASQECYGAVAVKYVARYVLYEYTFSGGPCPVPPPETSVFNPGFLLAFDATTGATATLLLDPPLCPGVFVNLGDKIHPQLRLEVDPKYEPRLRPGGTVPLGAECQLRLYPDVAATFNSNAGKVLDLGETGTHTVSEMVTFNGESATRLRYQPAGSVSLRKIGSFTDQFGRSFSPSLAGPGDTVNEVEWTSSTSYNYSGPRKLGPDEVALVSGSKAKAGYGVVEATYAVRYRRVKYQFGYDGDKKFDPGFVVAEFGDEAASIRVDTPEGGSL